MDVDVKTGGAAADRDVKVSLLDGVFTEGSVPDAMTALLSARLPLLCGIFGIDPDLPRDEQLLRIVWLVLFRGSEAVSLPLRDPRGMYGFRAVIPDGQTKDTAVFWGGQSQRSVMDLVKAVMLAG